MSTTSSDFEGVTLPDAAFLQELANQFFQAPPVPQGAASSIPSSVAGSGVSPSAVNQGNSVDINDPQTSLPDPHFAGSGHVPGSHAGSGKSPTAPYTNGDGGVPYQGNVSKGNGSPGNVSRGNASSGDVSSAKGAAANAPSAQSASEVPYLFSEWAPSYGSGDWHSFTGAIPGMGAAPSASPFPAAGATPDALFYFLDAPRPFVKPQNTHPAASALSSAPYDINRVKKDFPILGQYVNGRPLVWLDNAATTQKPRTVIDTISHFYENDNSNIHRAAHELAARATDAYEGAREKVRRFLNAASPNEIVFVRGSTEAINLVAKSWGAQFLQPGDEIIVSHLEHHANIVPWQQLAEAKGLKLKVIPVDDDGQILLDAYGDLLSSRTKLVAFTQVSNALGTITPAQKMIGMAHAVGAKVLLDGAQAVSHMPVDVQSLDPDWYVFSGHKVFGPTGIGVLYGRESLLNETQPWQGGGNMIRDVTFERTTYHQAPARFEAGTGNIADAVGLGAAIDYVMTIGMPLISQYEHYLLQYATRLLTAVPGLKLIGTAPDKAGVLSFVLDGYKTEDVGKALNREGIAVRSGHHCAQPILRRFGQESTVRPSLALYNTCSDIDALISALYRLVK